MAIIRYIMNSPQTSKSRRQMLEEFVAKNAEDAFGRYGLAMECMKTGDSAAAEENFKQLIAAHADYVAAYFQYGQMLAKLNRIDDARKMLTEGVSRAAEAGEEHARNELQAALDELG
ncbi:MAG TPA: tetratricopeptide repeat protein [Candidatus Acidoferrales bacterium]|nr:tetratricopeptide repeat protein [Candidatus Acidoferrales bacterium]